MSPSAFLTGTENFFWTEGTDLSTLAAQISFVLPTNFKPLAHGAGRNIIDKRMAPVPERFVELKYLQAAGVTGK